MRRSSRLPLLGLLPLLACSTPTARADVKADVDEGKKLLTEGDKLADKGDTTEATLRYKQAFEKLLPSMRKLAFKHEVKRDVTAREDLRAFLIKELDEDKSPAEFRGDELGMKALGFLPRDLDLKEVMVKVYSEEIAAFYDPRTKTMHLIKEPGGTRKVGLLERLAGKKGGFDKDEQKTVLAHELTHALADQNFDLFTLQKAIKGDDDRQLALSALIEGEATLTMMGAQMKDWEGEAIAHLPAADLERIFGFLGPLLSLGGGASLRSAPPIVVESMLFPYLRGLIFCARLANDGGWDAVTAAYREPPLSTEQILHPEKYSAKPDAPTDVDLGKLAVGPGWSERARNVVGEMQLGVLLKGKGGAEAAAGWDGDRFAAFEAEDGKLGLVWLTTWDTPADAREFARAYARFQTTKLGRDVPEPDAVPDGLRRPHRGAIFAVERRGQDVAVVEGFAPEATGPLLDAAFAAKKSEKARAAKAD